MTARWLSNRSYGKFCVRTKAMENYFQAMENFTYILKERSLSNKFRGTVTYQERKWQTPLKANRGSNSR